MQFDIYSGNHGGELLARGLGLCKIIHIARNRGHFAPVINCQRNLISKWRTKTIVVRQVVR